MAATLAGADVAAAQISPALLRACKLKFLPRLKFPPEAEDAFLASRTRFGRSVRIGLLIFATFTVALAPFGSLLASAPPSLMSLSTPIQLLFMLPFCLLALVLNSRSKATRLADISIYLLVPALVVGMLVQRVQGGEVGFDVPLEYTSLIIASFFFLGHLRFRRFLPLALLLLLATVVTEVAWVSSAEPTDYRMLVNLTLVMMGIFGGYSFEYVLRDAWLNRQMLEQLSMLDSLTGIFNRQGLEDALNRSIRRARRDSCGLVVVIVDIDYFKSYNDLLGREAGDIVIQRLAEIMAGVARRPMDFTARSGDDELTLVLYDATPDYAREVSEDLISAVENTRIKHPGSPVGPVLTVSVGMLSVEPAERVAPGIDVLRSAERLVDQARARGRNQLAEG